MKGFYPPKKSKHQLVSHCWNCSQSTKTYFEAYEDEYVRMLEKKLSEVADALKNQVVERPKHPISEF